ncbi:pyruvate, water dikinase regulatory protein [Temperatibacter marinus]|uniref:Putative pyruvate, phosphate dikinase regulatory protein n=1 Tax=Temperatibacter marinus TaxID=1456591 RepID=A0AA52HBD9_9PROT|nr:pyruvate, water dikinase regulatory protein [Temperatibacter marinus]WND03665.1 pyruvate, water dikinase regulatory protein [Temperatibacter marinus]
METQQLHLHLVSDSTGETLDGLLQAALVQFDGVDVVKHNWPLMRSPKQMERIIQDISENRGLVLYTIVNEDIRRTLEDGCRDLGFPVLAIMDPLINLLGSYFGVKPTGLAGRQHAMDENYFSRIEALDYTMAHDDGQLTEDLHMADIILVGVSRTSKTPTSIYLANKGFKTANVPFVPGCPMPEDLDHLHNTFVMGLTTSPDRLSQIRTNRLNSLNEKGVTDYAAIDSIQDEVKECRKYCRERNWQVLDVTRRSVEETAAAIINKFHLWNEENKG